MLVELVEDLLRLRLSLELHNDAHAVPVRLVPQVGDAVDALVLDQLRDLLDERRLVGLVRQLRDDDLEASAAAHFLNVGAGPDDDAALAVRQGQPDAVLLLIRRALTINGGPTHLLIAEDHPAGGKVRTFDELGEILQVGVRVLNNMSYGVTDLAQVVGRDVGRHADGDSGRTVDQQVGQARGQNHRLPQRVVEIGGEVDSVAIDVGQQLFGDGGQAGFGVAIGRRGVTVHGAEVALAIYQRVAHVEVLRQAHHGFVDGSVAVWMVLAQHLTDDGGGLAISAGGPQTKVMHGVEDAPLHRLQAVADVRQRTRDDYAHGVI